MKKLSLTLAVLGVISFGMAGTASAANNGKIIFNGTLTNISCDVGPGVGVNAGTNPGEINVDLGNVSFSDIGVSSENRFETAMPIQLLVNCSAGADQYNMVKMRLTARNGSGLDNNDAKLLRTTGAADGVGIGLLNASSVMMDLSGTETIDTTLIKDGASGATAEINFGAVYVLNGTPTNPGNADGFLPFVMDYE
ncbi:fimbrial protein [Pseudomonas syringae]|uniref:Fimbral biosynthesis protein n=1 Tax=Pseudomonas syringae pv. actinidiae ICMP 18807 TaxID=1194404 RepID=S6TXK0_PSESF|nr:fimbrial protein [Pseudomonas syringae]EPN34169.1 fimbral biosynthesis protein [Pseudomonas syringae pv. actinidiae ICMP 18807]MDU8429427.1 fimbrial protein [Pseudomonas syringae pv. actinidifoliorum]MDU8520527.1 fimbrial protein [Pseudomonas syringae pv. actinidifoliorum]MDU8526696.1 fimbrial protein [Pseudomonas syringae pv. actinidifoliorum]NAT24278.1 type 1 fimbrial protein [Pseudomonas syringae pv. actinidifoliorum]